MGSCTVVLFTKAKTTYIKILQKRRKVLWTEHFDKVENKPKYSVIIAKHAHGKGLHFLLIFCKREIYHYFVNFFKVSGRSIEEILSRWSYRSVQPQSLVG